MGVITAVAAIATRSIARRADSSRGAGAWMDDLGIAAVEIERPLMV